MKQWTILSSTGTYQSKSSKNHVLLLEETTLSQHSLLSFPPTSPPLFMLTRNQEMKTISAYYTKCVEFIWLFQSCCVSAIKWSNDHQTFLKLIKNYHILPFSIWGNIELGKKKKKRDCTFQKDRFVWSSSLRAPH